LSHSEYIPLIGCAYYAPGFRTQANFDEELTRQRAAGLLGCGDKDTNTINGLEVAQADGSGVCLSDGNGCGDCFDGMSCASTPKDVLTRRNIDSDFFDTN
jgi:hypothetical protein